METAAATSSTILDLELLHETPREVDPYEHVIVPGFIRPEAREAINRDYPAVARPGSFPLSEVKYGEAFAALVDELSGPEFRRAVESKFSVNLAGRPTMTTVRGLCQEKDGRIHTDSSTKIITVLIYMNSQWEPHAGRLRLLRSATSLDHYAVEIPPVEGTLLVFRRSEKSWHGHKPFSGPRRVIQFNWVTSEDVVKRELRRHRVSAWSKRFRGFWSRS